MVVENVYVILNSDDELKSIFEEDELNDFFNEYTYDLIEEVEKIIQLRNSLEQKSIMKIYLIYYKARIFLVLYIDNRLMYISYNIMILYI